MRSFRRDFPLTPSRQAESDHRNTHTDGRFVRHAMPCASGGYVSDVLNVVKSFSI